MAVVKRFIRPGASGSSSVPEDLPSQARAAVLGNDAVEQTTARVLSVDGESLIVQTAQGPREARRAASCLLDPEAQDLVLLARLSSGRDYVLAVLERTGQGALRLSAEGDLELGSRNGVLSLKGKQGIRLISEGAVGLVARSLEAVARDGLVMIRALAVRSETLHAETGSLKVLADAVDAAVDRVSAHFGRVFRKVDGLEQVQAGQLQLRVRQNLELRGNNALVSAKRLVKLTGEQVHMG
jgi:hypothetical protein